MRPQPSRHWRHCIPENDRVSWSERCFASEQALPPLLSRSAGSYRRANLNTATENYCRKDGIPGSQSNRFRHRVTKDDSPYCTRHCRVGYHVHHGDEIAAGMRNVILGEVAEGFQTFLSGKRKGCRTTRTVCVQRGWSSARIGNVVVCHCYFALHSKSAAIAK